MFRNIRASLGENIDREHKDYIFTNEVLEGKYGTFYIFDTKSKFEQADVEERIVVRMKDEKFFLLGYFVSKEF